MIYYKIADLMVMMENPGEELQKRMQFYQASPPEQADITINTDRHKMKTALLKHPHLAPDEWEYIQTGYDFACCLPDFDGFCLHSSAIAFDGRAVLFSGPSGTGKSTHANLWQQYFGEDRAVIINDDKPVLRLENDIFYVYGTPWSGKSRLNANLRIPLGAIVFLKQAERNYIRRLDNREALRLLIYQSQHPGSDRARMDRLLTLHDALLQRIPVYQLECDISFNAVEVVHREIYEKEINSWGNIGRFV